MMTSREFIQKAIVIANNYKTLYVMGCFGAPMTDANKKRYTNNHEYNMRPGPKAAILAASSDTFGFDCVCLIKGILWGWSGNKNHVYGGAVYCSNNVPDITADTMISRCSNVSADFSKIVPGEMLWKTGHAGIYIGNGMAVECTPAWSNCVQITDVGNIGSSGNRPTRYWTKHGKLPWVDYSQNLPFVDVPLDAWYYDDVKKCYQLGIIKGTDETHFSPNETVDRAQMSAIINRILEVFGK